MLSSPQLSKPGMQMTPYQGTSIQRIRASLSYLARRMPRIMAVLQKQFYHRAFSSLSRCKREVGDLVGLRNKTILARSMSESKVLALRACKEEAKALCDSRNCNPILVRLAWHDAGTFNKDSPEPWPRCGGANGSIRFAPEINHGANNGLVNALQLLQPIKDKHPEVGWADLIQLASAVAIEAAGGPVIDMKYGRKDATTPQCCVDEGSLPAGNAPFPDADTPQAHLRNVFYRMGFGDEGIVALSGAHTLGRAHKGRSGEGAETSKFTKEGACPRGAGKAGVGSCIGGSAWTAEWLKFDNSYYQTVPDKDSDAELLKLATDRCLFDDEGFKPFALKYKASQSDFFADYKKAHKQLSELGVIFEPEGGITI